MEAPILIGELELTEPDLAIPGLVRADGTSYHGVQLLVRMQHAPLGYIFLSADETSPEEICRRIWYDLGSVINRRRANAGLDVLAGLPVAGLPAEAVLADEITDFPFVTVVVCTRNRPDSVKLTLRSLANLRYASFQVVVVDNAPNSESTRDTILAEFGNDSRFRYVREPRPGLSYARNRGLAEAGTDIVAFTDDDVRVDPLWLTGLVRGFRAAPGVACVTGLIATAELDNPVQLYFHLREGWGSLCERRIFDLVENRDNSPLYPYSAGVFGAGANFAVSRALLADIGRFDEALGAGTLSGGGEDLNMFMRIILAGHRLVYEPSAIVWHVHRTDLTELSRQMRAYGSGCTAALTAILLADARARRDLPPKVLAGLSRMRDLSGRVRDNPKIPSGLIRREVGGFLVGPGLYLMGRQKIRRSSSRVTASSSECVNTP